jgi:hypothetical protein
MVPVAPQSRVMMVPAAVCVHSLHSLVRPTYSLPREKCRGSCAGRVCGCACSARGADGTLKEMTVR